MPLLPPGVHEHFPSDAAQLTPLFRQYTQIKREQPRSLLLYRLGDFYELFGPDAVRAAELLQITLTSRACGSDYKVAMCGVPHHSAVRYIKRLVQAGEIVAICEQTQYPALAKGLVERSVTRVITAGTLIEDEYLSADNNNFLAVVAARGERWGLALLESSGGRVELCELARREADGDWRELAAAVLRFSPAEVLAPEALLREPGFAAWVHATPGPALHSYDNLPGETDVQGFLQRFFDVATLMPFGLGEAPAAQAALFALVRYLRETFKVGEVKLYPRLVPLAGTLYLDRRCVEHLELLAPPSGAPGDGPGAAGLYGVLNRCATAGGRRQLKQALLAPLAFMEAISARHDAVEWLLEHQAQAGALSVMLARTQDVERIANRVALRRSHPKEVRALIDSLPHLSEAGARLRENRPDGIVPALLLELGTELCDFTALHLQLDALLADSPPVKPAGGGVIRPGADARVDELTELAGGGREWFERYETSERERTGIKTIKVKFTEAFGYFIEISKANASLAPVEYKRKQTLVNAERFTTAELIARETDVRNAESQLQLRVNELLEGIYETVSRHAELLSAAARAAALLDMLLSFAIVAKAEGWVRPGLAVSDPLHLEIDAGRHPLVEQSVGARYYTPNSCFLDQEAQQIAVLTGPNMGGKSTYLRMVAVLAVLSQCGSFVPAARAVLPVFDRVFTRVGAQDYLSRNQSTFMVEMVETAEILNTCSGRSLLILDEVGRGTSTYDGISIAKAVVEYLHELPARPLTLFATHFFELTDLPLVLSRVKNFQVEVAREGGRFVFLYRVAPGAASESFGIEVAALAGLPEAVVTRARQILYSLEEAKQVARDRARQAVQLGLFGGEGEGK